MNAKLTPIDEYLAGVDEPQRSALEKLRRTIRAAVPEAEECLSYGVAAFRLGRPLVGFGATGTDCVFYLMSGSTVSEHAEDLAGYATSKGSIRFAPGKPLPAALVRKLVKARLGENEKLAAAAPRAKRKV